MTLLCSPEMEHLTGSTGAKAGRADWHEQPDRDGVRLATIARG
jgi:hypothetical protein